VKKLCVYRYGGCTALTQKDEALALEILEEHRIPVRPLLRKYGGKEIMTLGDSFTVGFQSTLKGV
jgi:adenylate cyclase